MTVFCCYNNDGNLLYVDIATGYDDFLDTVSSKEWFKEVSNVQLQHFVFSVDALEKKNEVIALNYPVYN